jgi:hypothetical protein
VAAFRENAADPLLLKIAGKTQKRTGKHRKTHQKIKIMSGCAARNQTMDVIQRLFRANQSKPVKASQS